MSQTWTIRPARPADVGVVATLSDGLFQEDSRQRDPLMNHDWAKTYGQSYFAGLLANPAYLLLVAEHTGEVVGYLAGARRDADELRPVVSADLESMFVAQNWRGRGVGQALAEAFLAWAREYGVVWITVTAYSANTGACAFYERLGFASHTVTLGLVTRSMQPD